MIITKIIILYFIQIRHSDDFPSTGTRLVIIIIIVVVLMCTILKSRSMCCRPTIKAIKKLH